MTASGRGNRSDSFEREEGFALPGESVRLHRPVRSRGVAGAPAERGAPHAVGAGGKAFPTLLQLAERSTFTRHDL